MTETVLVSALVQTLRKAFPSFVIFKHADKFTFGVPDISVTGRMKTTWLEVKYADPTFLSSGVQELAMKRLSATSYGWYVIYDENEGHRRTLLVVPELLSEWKTQHIAVDTFDHEWVAMVIGKVHS